MDLNGCIDSSVLCKTITCVTQTDSGLFVCLGVWGLKQSCCGRSQKGRTVRCHFGVQSQTSSQCQCELHHPGTVRLAQPVAEMHHGRRTIDAVMGTVPVRCNILVVHMET